MKNILQSLNPVRKSKDNPSVERKTSGELISSLSNGIKIIALGLVLALGISYAFAWTAPTQAPPAGNVSAPVNVGGVGQIKSAGLQVNGFRNIGNTILSGNVGIGTIAVPTEKLEVVGNIKASGTVCDSTGCLGGAGAETDPTVLTSVKDGVDWTEVTGIPAGFADNIDNVGTGEINRFGGIYTDLLDSTCKISNPFTGACSCPSGYISRAINTINPNNSGKDIGYYCYK